MDARGTRIEIGGDIQVAEKLHTSRTQVRRLLDPENTSITLATLQRAADVTGHRLVIGFKPLKKHGAATTIRRASTHSA